MSLEMKTACESCARPLTQDDLAFICSYECTFCPECQAKLVTCPTCQGELNIRPRRNLGNSVSLVEFQSANNSVKSSNNLIVHSNMLSEHQIEPPNSDEYFEYYHRYISRAPKETFLANFGAQGQQLHECLADLPAGEDDHLHAEFSWTLKQVVGHLIDVERLFSTRMLRIAAGDATPIPGYEHADYVTNLDYQQITLDELIKEFSCLRQANVLLVSRLSPEALKRCGTASGHVVSARANLFILAGHFVHHLEIIQRRVDLVRGAQLQAQSTSPSLGK